MKSTKIIGLIALASTACYQFSLSQGGSTHATESTLPTEQFSLSQHSPISGDQEIYVNPDWDSITQELHEAYASGTEELDKVLKKYDPQINPDAERLSPEAMNLLESYKELLHSKKRSEVLDKARNPGEEYTDAEWEILLEDFNGTADAELEELVKKLDPNYTPEPEPGYEEMKAMLDSYQNLLDVTKQIEKIRDNSVEVTAKGTGRTTGHIADLTVNNKTREHIYILPEKFYIPSDGKYQSYVGRISEGYTVPPETVAAIPVEGYCADVHTPPVPLGNAMPSLDTWITVGHSGDPDIVYGQPSVPEPMNPPNAGGPPSMPEPMNPPNAGGPPAAPEPMNPPGTTTGAPQVPEPMNPPGASVPVKLLPRDPVPSFTPELIPEINPTPNDKGEDAIIVTFPGTETPVEGTIDPTDNPPVYGTVLVEAVTQLEEAYEVIRETEQFPTPYFADVDRERESVIQQTFWIYTAALTGNDYEQDDFETKVYDQFQSTTGKSVTALPEEQKEQVDQGVTDFWNTFQATGVEAKIISVTSPDLIDPDMVLATVSSPKCKCNDISYDVEVKRGAVVVHTGSYTSRDNPEIAIKDFKYGEAFDVKISNISANCKCDEADCEFYPAESTNSNSPGYTKTDTSRPGEVDIEMDNDPSGEIGSKGNNNCQYKDKAWDAATKELSFTLETRDEKTNNKSVFQRISLKGYCQLEDCRRALCKKTIQLNFVTAK